MANLDENVHVVMPLKEHTHTIIMLHGKGSNATEFAPEFFQSQASDGRTLREILPSVKWVFPTSGERYSALFEKDRSQWFDMWSVQEPQERLELQIQGLKESVAFVLEVIRKESESVGVDHVILGGISQGCATAIHALFQGGQKLGGFLGLSSWLPMQEKINKLSKPADVRSLLGTPHDGQTDGSMFSTPVFLSHSLDDHVVPARHGQALQETLKSLGMKVKWKAYKDGGHWVNEPKGVDDMALFLRTIMG